MASPSGCDRASLVAGMKPRYDSKPWQRLDVSAGVGLLLGCAYTVVDVYIDHFMRASLRAPGGPLEVFHAIVDLVLPAVTGTLMGVALHYTKVRAKMAAFEKQRADELAGHLHKIEREQAVWVIAASLLHELKNPLHSLGLLLDEVAELPDSATSERSELLRRARSQSERIEARLMALRSLESSRPPELPRVDLLDCIEGLVEPLARLAQRRNATLRLEGGPVVASVHPGYLRIILENLIENALDVLPPSGEVTIRVGDDGSEALVTVTDNGPGLSEDTRERMFEPLFSHKESGLGLGLAIARGLARSMGGDLSVAPSAKGAKGAKLELHLRGGEQ